MQLRVKKAIRTQFTALLNRRAINFVLTDNCGSYGPRAPALLEPLLFLLACYGACACTKPYQSRCFIQKNVSVDV